jgi:hypothetical protein
LPGKIILVPIQLVNVGLQPFVRIVFVIVEHIVTDVSHFLQKDFVDHGLARTQPLADHIVHEVEVDPLDLIELLKQWLGHVDAHQVLYDFNESFPGHKQGHTEQNQKDSYTQNDSTHDIQVSQRVLSQDD